MTYGINCNFLSVMGGFKVLDWRGEDIGYAVLWGEADNKNIFSNLFFICRDPFNDYKLA